MPKKRNNYTAEFKQKAVRLVVEENQSVPDIARSLGIPAGSLNRWIRAWKDSKEQAFPGHGKQMLTPEQLLIKQLQAENKQLKSDNELLKKAAAFFAKDTL